MADDATFWPWLSSPAIGAWPNREATVVVMPLAGMADWGLGHPLDAEETVLMHVLRDALSVRGSLWLHLDHRTVHDAKVVADRVLGRPAFRGEIIWVPGNGGRGRRRRQPLPRHGCRLPVHGRCHRLPGWPDLKVLP